MLVSPSKCCADFVVTTSNKQLNFDQHIATRQGPSERVETEQFHGFTYPELMARDKTNLDITWLVEFEAVVALGAASTGTDRPRPQARRPFRALPRHDAASGILGHGSSKTRTRH